MARTPESSLGREALGHKILRWALPLDEPVVDHQKLEEKERERVRRAEEQVLSQADGIGDDIVRALRAKHGISALASTWFPRLADEISFNLRLKAEMEVYRYGYALQDYIREKTGEWYIPGEREKFARFAGGVHARKFSTLSNNPKYRSIAHNLGFAAGIAIDVAVGFDALTMNNRVDPKWADYLKSRARTGRMDTADLGRFIYDPPRTPKKL